MPRSGTLTWPRRACSRTIARGRPGSRSSETRLTDPRGHCPGEWTWGASTTRQRFQHGNWAPDQRTGQRPGPRAAPGRRLENDVLTQVVASIGHGCYHASYGPIVSAYIEPCWRQHYPHLVLGFASINASTADSSQLTASDAGSVRPDSGRSAPVRRSGGSRRGPQPTKTPPTDRAGPASTYLGRLPGCQVELGALDRPRGDCTRSHDMGHVVFENGRAVRMAGATKRDPTAGTIAA